MENTFLQTNLQAVTQATLHSFVKDKENMLTRHIANSPKERLIVQPVKNKNMYMGIANLIGLAKINYEDSSIVLEEMIGTPVFEKPIRFYIMREQTYKSYIKALTLKVDTSGERKRIICKNPNNSSNSREIEKGYLRAILFDTQVKVLISAEGKINRIVSASVYPNLTVVKLVDTRTGLDNISSKLAELIAPFTRKLIRTVADTYDIDIRKNWKIPRGRAKRKLL